MQSNKPLDQNQSPDFSMYRPISTTATTQSALNHLKQLDGIRFIAVSLVLFDHWTAGHVELPLGSLGVTIFFVLSGFLITRILLASKDKLSNQPNGGLSKYLKTFYIRRSLRIFPIYYLTLLVLYIVDLPPVRRTIGWLALYGANLYMAYFQTWLGPVDHLWSLAVEEQFYLFFPLLLFFVPRRWVPLTTALMIIGSVALRYVFYRARMPFFTGYVSMPTCLDSFGLGAIMAFWWLYQLWVISVSSLCFQPLSSTAYAYPGAGLELAFRGHTRSEQFLFLFIFILSGINPRTRDLFLVFNRKANQCPER